MQESIRVKFWQIAVDLFFLKVPLRFNHKKIFCKIYFFNAQYQIN